MATQQRCPKCNHPNSSDAVRCANCNAPFVQRCPRCGATRPWYVQHCPHCSGQAEDTAVFTGLFRQAPSQRLRGRYMVQETLATGPVSAVYRAVDTKNAGAVVTVKEFGTTALFRADERREAEAAFALAVARWQRVQHPAIPRILDTFSERERLYLVTDLLMGKSLRQVLAEYGAVASDIVCNWGVQLCHVIEHLSAQDPPLHMPFLAPAHVMVTYDGLVRLVDLGLTYLFAPNTYGPYGSVRGYAAPELDTEPPSAQSDIFSVGRLLYALLIGRPLEKAVAAQLPTLRSVAGVSPQLAKIIAQAAQRDVSKRFAAAGALRAALEQVAPGSLEPVADWTARMQGDLPSAAPVLAPTTPSVSESMADLGYVRDERFGSVPARAPAPERRPTVVKFSVHPRQFDLGELSGLEARRLVLSLRNTGEGELIGRIVSHVGWISAPKQAVRLPAQKEARVILTVRAALLPSPKVNEPQAISIESEGGRQWIGVSAEVATGPSLLVEQPVLDFGTLQGETERSLPMTLTNKGQQPLTGSVASQVPWLRVPHGAFRLSAGQSAQVAVQLLGARIPRGPQKVDDALLVDSNGGQARVHAEVWCVRPELDLGTTHMDLGTVSAEQVVERLLYVGNTGDGALEGTARSLVPWLQVHPQQIACSPGELVQLTVMADCVGLPDGPIEIPQALRIQTNGGARTLSLRAVVSAPKLVLGTTQLAFGTLRLGETRELRLVLRNEGSAPLKATIQPLVSWLSLPVSEITCEPKGQVVVSVQAVTTSFARGVELLLPAAVRISAGNVVQEIPASMTILQPTLRVEPEELDFGYIDPGQPETQNLVISNDGTGKLAWNVQTDAAWVEVLPKSGEVLAGQAQALAVIAYGLALEAGVSTASATLIVNSDGGRAKVPLRVALASPRLSCDTTALLLGPSVNLANVAGSFRLFNHGLGLLRGTITPDRTWLSVDHASFECAMGRSIEVQVQTDMDEFPAGATHGEAMIKVHSNGGDASIAVAVAVVLAPHLEVGGEALQLDRQDLDHPLQGRLSVKNTGRAPAQVRLVPSAPELALMRNLVDIKPDKSVRIAVQWQGSPTARSDQQYYVDLVCGDQRIRVPVILEHGQVADVESAPISRPPSAVRG